MHLLKYHHLLQSLLNLKLYKNEKTSMHFLFIKEITIQILHTLKLTSDHSSPIPNKTKSGHIKQNNKIITTVNTTNLSP